MLRIYFGLLKQIFEISPSLVDVNICSLFYSMVQNQKYIIDSLVFLFIIYLPLILMYYALKSRSLVHVAFYDSWLLIVLFYIE